MDLICMIRHEIPKTRFYIPFLFVVYDENQFKNVFSEFHQTVYDRNER